MARNNASQNQSYDIENVIRRIVREELRESFTFNLEGQEEQEGSSGTPRQRRARSQSTGRNGQAKGRVTDPQNDRRLRGNREA